MRIGIVFDLKEDYGIQNEDTDYYDFCFLSEAEAAFNHLQLAGYDVFYIGNQSALYHRSVRHSVLLIPARMLLDFLCPYINTKLDALLRRIIY